VKLKHERVLLLMEIKLKLEMHIPAKQMYIWTTWSETMLRKAVAFK